MANTKISALTSGGAAQNGDLLPIDRSGANFSLTAQSIVALASIPPVVISDIAANTDLVMKNVTAAAPASSAWGYSSSITIAYSKVNGNLLNFPVLIAGTYSQLATVANGGHVQNANGYDIVFSLTPYYSGSILNHEIVSYTASTGAVIYNVQVPTLSSTVNTVIYVLYGNSSISTSQAHATSVWDANFLQVTHMGVASGQLLDSTVTGNNSTVNTGTQTTGKWGNATAFSSQYASCPALWSTNTPFTVSMWANVASVSGNYAVLWNSRQTTGSNQGAEVFINITTGYAGANLTASSGQSLNGTTNIADGGWHYLVLTYDGTSGITLSVDGAVVSSISDSLSAMNGWASGWVIGNIAAGTDEPTVMQELRISNSARAIYWNATEYNNQSSPSTFYTVGSAAVVTGPVVNQSSPAFELAGTGYSGSASATDDWTIQDVVSQNVPNPASTLTLAHSGSSGVASVSVPNLLVAGLNANLNGGLTAEFYPEAYGAYRDGIHDDTAAIQAAINAAVANGGGTVVLGVGTYNTSASLVINGSSIKMQGARANTVPGMTAAGTTIMCTAPLCDAIQVTGTSGHNVLFVELRDFSLMRSVSPRGTAAGVRYTYALATITERLYVWDHIYGFYIDCTGTGTGHVDHASCYIAWSSVSLNGPFYGVYLNGATISTRIVDVVIAGTSAGTTYGMYSPSGGQDLFVDRLETAGCSYGVYFTSAASDVLFNQCIHDSCAKQAWTFTGNNAVSVIGGYVDAGSSTQPMVSLNNCSGVTFVGTVFLMGPTNTTAVSVTGTSKGNAITGCVFNGLAGAGGGTCVLLNAATSCSIGSNIMIGPLAYGVSLVGASYNTVNANDIYGSSGHAVTVGVSYDSTSTYNSGVNAINPAFVTAPISDSGTGNGLIAAGMTVDAQGSSVSAYTAVLGDANNLVTMSDASASTFTVPPNSSVAFPVGSVLTVNQYGAGQITLTPGIGVTFVTPRSLTTRAQYSTVSLTQVSANTWVAGGDLT